MSSGREGHIYILNFIDDFSDFFVVYPLKNHTGLEVLKVFKEYIAKSNSLVPDAKITMFRCDGANEFVKGQLADYCRDQRILLDPSPPYTPQLNGHAERFNKTSLEKMWALIFDSKIPTDEWHLVAKMSEYIINRSPNRTNQNFASPFELYFSHTPDMSRLRVPGSFTYTHLEKDQCHDLKLGERSIPCVLMGYTSNGYLIQNPISRKLYRSCNVICIENKGYKECIESCKNNPFFIGSSNDQPDNEAHLVDHSYCWPYVGYSNMPTRLSDCVPLTYVYAVKNPFANQWRAAIESEFESLQLNNTWNVIPRPKCHLISTCWVFNV